MKSIRKAKQSDAIVFYLARYSTDAIKFSKNKSIPSYEDHCKWFDAQDLERCFVIQEKDAGVGYIRVDIENYLSIAIYPHRMKKGYASYALSEIVKMFIGLKAEVHKDNIASIRLFEKYKEISMSILY